MKSAVMSLAIVAVGALHAVAAPPTIHNLGTLGGTDSLGIAINASGEVAGSSSTADNSARRAFLYTGTPGSGGAMVDLGTLGGTDSFGIAISASGQVAGSSNTADNSARRAFLYTGTPGVDGRMIDLGLGGRLDALSSSATGINDGGQVVGSVYSLSPNKTTAFLYTGTPGSDGVVHDLGTLGGTHSSAAAINTSGQITGWADTSSGASHAFLYTGTPGEDGKMIDLGILPGWDVSRGDAVNASGQIAGTSTMDSGRQRAFLYTGTPGVDGRMFDLGTLPDMVESVALAINDRGQVAGSSYTADYSARRAFLYTGTPGLDGQMIDLNAWLDANNPAEGAKWTLLEVRGLNDSGLLTGEGIFNDGPGGLSDGTRAFILDASALVVIEPPPNLPPTVSITRPVNGQTYAAPASIDIDAEASDSDGTVVRVDLYVGDTLLASDDSAPFELGWDNVSAGSYSLTATATDNLGATTTSAPVNITVTAPPAPPPAAPTDAKARPVSRTKIKLRWIDNARDETTYKVERSLNGKPFRELIQLGANVTQFVDRRLAPGKRYHYRVRAYNAAGDSSYSNTTKARTLQ